MSQSTWLNKKLFGRILTQGPVLAVVKILRHIFPGKNRNWVEKCKVNLIKRKIRREHINITQTHNWPSNPLSQNIWICWLQGEDNMPGVVHLCYDSIQKNANGHPVVLITFENFRQYVILPDQVIALYMSGDLLPALFADILRVNLLAQHGGLWLDATIWAKQPLPEEWFHYSFFSMKFYPDIIEASQRRWVSYCLGRGQNHDVLFCKAATFFDEYTKRHNQFLDYFMIDYVFDYIYDIDEEARVAIDALEYNNIKTTGLLCHLCDTYNEQLFWELTEGTTLFKLRFRPDEESEADLMGNGDTIYSHMKELTYNISNEY